MRATPAVIGVAALVMSCTTFRWQAQKPERQIVTGDFAVLRGSPFLSVSAGRNVPHEFIVTNRSHETLFISYRHSAAEVGGQSFHVSGGSPNSPSADLSTRDKPIAAGERTPLTLHIPGNKKVQEELASGASVTYRLALRNKAGKGDYVLFRASGTTKTNAIEPVLFTTEVGMKDKIACYVTAPLLGGWCWFIKPGTEDFREATEKAKDELGLKDFELYFLQRE